MPPDELPAEGRDAFPYLLPITTRWKDNDVYGHVNNVDFYSFFDTAINTWLIVEGGLDIHGGEAIGVCAESRCAYHAPIAFPQTVDAALRVRRIGHSSVSYELAIFGAGDAPAATGSFVHVFVSRETRRPVEIPSGVRAALERLLVP